MPATVRPADGFIVVKPVRPNAMSKEGLLVKENIEPGVSFGRITAIGRGRTYMNLKTGELEREEVPFKEGEVVRISTAALCRPEGLLGPEYGIVDIHHVLAVIDGFEEHDEKQERITMAMDRPKVAGPGLLVPPHLANGAARRRA